MQGSVARGVRLGYPWTRARNRPGVRAGGSTSQFALRVRGYPAAMPPPPARTPLRTLCAGVVCTGSLLLAPASAIASAPASTPAAAHRAAAPAAVRTVVNPAYPAADVSNGKWGLIGLTGMFGLFGYRAYTARRRPERPTKGDRQ